MAVSIRVSSITSATTSITVAISSLWSSFSGPKLLLLFVCFDVDNQWLSADCSPSSVVCPRQPLTTESDAIASDSTTTVHLTGLSNREAFMSSNTSCKVSRSYDCYLDWTRVLNLPKP